jgi:protein-S-isoprenylcysteine O-methyltransferase Ste14
MVVRVSRRKRRVHRVLIPAQLRERLMWMVWVPLVAAWIAMPYVASAQNPTDHPSIGVPEFASSGWAFATLRTTVAGVAFVCLLLSIQCWRHMGRDWRMGVDPEGKNRLITDGPFAKVRHPIYALSIALMLCSVVVIPTPVMLVIAAVHITLMYLKARNEESFLTNLYGQSYSEYCERTGRFLPRIGTIL